MCGIIGFLGGGDASRIIVEGLEKLEYRGYDSAGWTVLKGDAFVTHKTTKRVAALKQKAMLGGTVGIGHTRWATHGAATLENAHPHFSSSRKFAVVHNGIIENYQQIRSELEAEGISFKSGTDSEVVPHLLEKFYKKSLKSAVLKTVKKLKGSFALGIICSEHPDIMIGVRNQSPLLVGLGDGDAVIASDKNALPPDTNSFFSLEDGEFVLLKKDSFSLFDFSGKAVQRKPQAANFSSVASGKNGFSHFMLKEIYEQPEAMRTVLKEYLKNGKPYFKGELFEKDNLSKIKQVQFVACGSAYNAGMAAKYFFEELLSLPVFVDIASEFRYKAVCSGSETLVIAISQSGETADTIAALREAARKGAKTIAVVNVEDSTLARIADCSIPCLAGPEIAVATTKGWSTQLLILYLLGLFWADKTNTNPELSKKLLTSIKTLPKKAEQLLTNSDGIKDLADSIKDRSSVFFIGRNTDFPACLEASLKLKEITYIHSEAYPSGELKHGTISLIEEGTAVFALCCNNRLLDKQISNIKEVLARNGEIICCATDKNDPLLKDIKPQIKIPDCEDLISPLLEVLPFQLLAFWTAFYKDLDIDKPRNLAKSVTVE